MLDAIKDGNDARPASPRKEGFLEATETDVGNRMVYKLVKVGDDGSVLAAIEDDVFQSLVGGLDNGLSFYNPEGGDTIRDDKEGEESDCVASDGDDSNGRTNIIPIQDLAVERQRLKAQIEVLDCILMKVDLKKRKRLSAKKEVAKSVDVCESHPSIYLNTCDVGSGDYKRQRRPNPKYFDYDAGDDSLMGPLVSSTIGESMPRHLSSRKLPPKKVVAVLPRGTSNWGAHHNSSRAVGASHKSKAVKPLSRTLCKVASTCPVLSIVSKEHNILSLDNLSIRELHKAFCSTFGRETSVKDKHWLKRQISNGWMRQQEVVIRSTSHQQVQNKIKARLDYVNQAEQPLSTAFPLNVGNIKMEAANNERQLQKANDVELFRDAFRSKLGSRCFQQRVTTPTILSGGGSFEILTTGSLNESSAQSGATAIYGEVVNNGEIVEGKRQRKPNRRYIEDEVHVASGFVPMHDTWSFYGDNEDVGVNLTTSYSWRTMGTDGSSDLIGRHGTIRGSNLQNVFSKKFSAIQRPKLISSGMKQKVGSRAAKLVIMAHNTTRVAQHHVQAAICRAKLQLPATPDITMNDKIEMNEEVGDQVSTGLPIEQFDPSSVVQPLVLDERGKTEQLMVTVSTPNGRTRRKHHRPWTLREVMTLVEGVARCGGGKWADIKKLAFSTVGYRTAVDLKDKWRNLLRASRAQLHLAKQGEKKKQFTATIPTPILTRVHELASLSNQIPSRIVSTSNTSRSGRIVHRR